MNILTLARKPFPTSAARNVREFGTGGINIDATRVPMSLADEESIVSGGESRMKRDRKPGVSLMLSVNPMPWIAPTIHPGGRFPTNVLLEHTAECRLLGKEGKVDQWACTPACITKAADEYVQADGNARIFRQFGGNRG